MIRIVITYNTANVVMIGPYVPHHGTFLDRVWWRIYNNFVNFIETIAVSSFWRWSTQHHYQAFYLRNTHISSIYLCFMALHKYRSIQVFLYRLSDIRKLKRCKVCFLICGPRLKIYFNIVLMMCKNISLSN